MEDNPQTINSPILSRPSIQKHFDQLARSMEEAQKRIDYTTAHDAEIVRAIHVVERFLRKKRRVCYGGQAINALLPQKLKFYDEKYTIPDYDFFSPSMQEDVEELIAMLLEEKFEDVNKKVGVHDGTMKVMVNYVAVADCSAMHPQMFSIVQRKAHLVGGILYVDPDFLRMMMYLELSRPRGEIDRWKKVYERLVLLNHSYPPGKCDQAITTVPGISTDDRVACIDFCMQNKRVLVGPEVVDAMLMTKGILSKEILLQKGGPTILLSETAEQDANDLKDILQHVRKGVKVKHYEVWSDSLFPFYTITRRGEKLAMIFQIEACEGYVIGRFKEGGQIRIGHPDTLLHLYYSLHLFGHLAKTYFQTSLQCLVEKLHSLMDTVRGHPTEFLPAFTLRCSGQQKGIATLLKLRQARTEKEKQAKKQAKQSATRKQRKLS